MIRSCAVALEITPVDGRADLKEFVHLPYRLHAGTKWVPPLLLERYAFHNHKLNPFFKHGEAQLFLARRQGRVVGRISAQIDRNFNSFHNSRWGFYGFLEFEDDQEILDGLLAAAEAWLKARGCDRAIGPFDYTINQECGILIEGFDIDPMIQQPWHPPYYRERIEQAGLIKAMDVFHWHLDMSYRGNKLLPKLEEIAVASREKHGITIRKMSYWKLRKDLDEFNKVYNAAWSQNWAFTPYDDHDIADQAVMYRIVWDQHWFMIAENEAKETVAVALTIPDANQILKKMKGRVLPFGWWHYLRRKSYIDRVRVGFLGVMPEYQHTGVAAQLYIENFDMCKVTPVRTGEPGWILETNTSMNRSLEAMGGYINKRARIYERLLDDAAEPAAPPQSVRRYRNAEQRKADRTAKSAAKAAEPAAE
jgi:GNAT superfamily N-acetyltransferase